MSSALLAFGGVGRVYGCRMSFRSSGAHFPKLYWGRGAGNLQARSAEELRFDNDRAAQVGGGRNFDPRRRRDKLVATPTQRLDFVLLAFPVQGRYVDTQKSGDFLERIDIGDQGRDMGAFEVGDAQMISRARTAATNARSLAEP